MDKNTIKKSISEIESSISKLSDKKSKLLFFVADSKGTPIGSLSYTYGLAMTLKNLGYTVQMLYAEKDFVGVGSWLGEEYAELPHYNVTKDIIDVSPGDILFIPELYSSVMTKTRELRCKKIAILQNWGYMTELIPYGASWASMGIHECITTSESLKERLLEVFPKIKVHVIHPAIEQKTYGTKKKQLIVNIVSKDESVINSIVKPFKWRHPEYGFVTFRYVNGQPHDKFLDVLSEGEITVWVDEHTDFGYSALEAMACGNIVIGKIPENEPEWMMTDDGEIADNGVWFYKYRDIPNILSSVLHKLLHNGIPSVIYENAKKTVEQYTPENRLKDIKYVIEETIIPERINELTLVKNTFKNNLESKEEK